MKFNFYSSHLEQSTCNTALYDECVGILNEYVYAVTRLEFSHLLMMA